MDRHLGWPVGVGPSSGGSGGTTAVNPNKLVNGYFESDISGWNVYADAASSSPVDGTGGAPTLTLSRVLVTPLAGVASLGLVKAGSNIQGQGVSTDFSIDLAETIDTFQIAFKYSTPVGYVDDDIKVFLYDITNANLIPISTNSVPASGGKPAYFQAVFSPSSSKNYRLIFHIASTSASSWTVLFDTIEVNTRLVSVAGAIGKVPDYIPTGTGFGTITSTFTDLSRIGNKIYGKIRFTSGTTTSVVGTISLPPGVTTGVDTNTVVGFWTRFIAGINVNKKGVILAQPGEAFLRFGADEYAVNIAPSTSLNADAVSSSGDKVELTLDGLPISQWTTNINLAGDFTEYGYNSDISSTAIVSTGSASGKDGINISANWSSTGTQFQRRITFSRQISPTDIIVVETNNVSNPNAWADVKMTWPLIAQASLRFGMDWIPVSGDPFSIDVLFRPNGPNPTNVTYGTGPGSAWSVLSSSNKWRVRKISNGNTAEQAPLIRADYIFGTTTGNDYLFKGAVKVEDTHSAFSSVNGWFTAPISGVYRFTGAVICAAISSQIWLNKNNGNFRILCSTPGSSSWVNVVGSIRLLAGETAGLFAGTSSSFVANGNSWFSVERIGS